MLVRATLRSGSTAHVRAPLLLPLLFFCAAESASAQQIVGDFQGLYSFTDLGAVPGLPTSYGGLTFLPNDPNHLLIGGAANGSTGRLYTIAVTRGADDHITGFACTATQFGEVGENNDGGVTFGPDGVLFTARYSLNQLGQTRPGSSDEDRIDDLGPHGVQANSSISAVNFVPSGFAGAGQMKLVTYSGGSWYTLPFTADGAGSFDLGTATFHDTLTGGPEGFVYADAANPGFGVDSIILSEYQAGKVAVYAIDANGDPVVATRRDFITGLSGAEGAVIDPLTGDFLFSTFGSSNHVIVVQGFVTHEVIFADGFDPQGGNCGA